jgi:Tfp pilus assembly protein PilF
VRIRLSLGTLYLDHGKYAEAEPLLKRALASREKALEADHPDVATSLENLGSLYRKKEKPAKAEPLLKRSLAFHEMTLGVAIHRCSDTLVM